MTKFVPEIRDIIHEYADSAPNEVEALEQKLAEVTNSDNWKWSVNKEDPAVKAAREKRQQEFNARYK
jgi:hypothetical protein